MDGAGFNKENALLTMPVTSILRNHCEACSGVGTFIPKRLCSKHKQPLIFTQSANWVLTWGMFGFGGGSGSGGEVWWGDVSGEEMEEEEMDGAETRRPEVSRA
jgi:hypothetical protein